MITIFAALNLRIVYILCGLCLACGCFTMELKAAERPFFEMGVGVAGGQSPHYIGSNEYYRLWAPFPYAILRQEVFEAGDRNRYFFYNDHRFQIEIGLGVEWPLWTEGVQSPAPDGFDDPNAVLLHKKSWLRRGMDKHPLNVLMGITASYHLGEHLYFALPIRQGVGLIRSMPNMGQVASWVVSYDLLDRKSPHAIVIQRASSYGSQRFNQIYYGVQAKDVLAGRPEYQASGGLLYSLVSLMGSFDLSQAFYLELYYERFDMRSSDLIQSPLVVAPVSDSVGVTVIYKFFVSRHKVKIDK